MARSEDGKEVNKGRGNKGREDNNIKWKAQTKRN
jgi:hypothetical protein